MASELVNLYTKINLPSILSLFSKTYLTLGGTYLVGMQAAMPRLAG